MLSSGKTSSSTTQLVSVFSSSTTSNSSSEFSTISIHSNTSSADETKTSIENLTQPRKNACQQVTSCFLWGWGTVKKKFLFWYPETSNKEKILKTSASIIAGYAARIAAITYVGPYIGSYYVLQEIIAYMASITAFYCSQKGISQCVGKYNLFDERFNGLVVMNTQNNKALKQMVTSIEGAFSDIIDNINLPEERKIELKNKTLDRLKTITPILLNPPKEEEPKEKTSCATCYEKTCCCTRLTEWCGSRSNH